MDLEIETHSITTNYLNSSEFLKPVVEALWFGCVIIILILLLFGFITENFEIL